MIRIVLSRKLGELRITRKQLSNMTGIRENTIGQYYNEYAETMKLEHLDLICEALSCGIDEILKLEPNKIPKIVHDKAGKPLPNGP